MGAGRVPGPAGLCLAAVGTPTCGVGKEGPGPYRHASVVLAGTPAPSPETAEEKYSRPAP